MRVWIYASGGQAEYGVIDWFKRHFPSVYFEQRTPRRPKPGLKPRYNDPDLTQVLGYTGKDLERRIRDDVTNYWGPTEAQLFVLVDDTDCGNPTLRAEALRTAVSSSLPAGESPCVAVALAVPELEIWLIADWNGTVKRDKPGCEHAVREALKQQGVSFTKPESFDCYCDPDPAPYRKVSETLIEAYRLCCSDEPKYSKATDTSRLLVRADPNVIAKRCPTFRAFWDELGACLRD